MLYRNRAPRQLKDRWRHPGRESYLCPSPGLGSAPEIKKGLLYYISFEEYTRLAETRLAWEERARNKPRRQAQFE